MTLAQRIALRYIKTKFNLLSAISKKKAAEKAFALFCTPQKRVKKKLPPVFEKAKEQQIRIDGIRVTGWQWLPEVPVTKKALILHGYESSAINFDRYVKPLLRTGYEVLAFDAPAHGRSKGKQINAPLYKKMIVEINRVYGPINSFMAHSFGGLAVALALEEISHTTATKLVLIAPATETTTAINSFFSFLELDERLRPEFEKVIIRKGGVSASWYSVKRAMHNIRAQVLWVHDEDDTITPIKDVVAVQETGYPNIEFLFTKGLGHRRIYRDNQVTKKIIAFLQ